MGKLKGFLTGGLIGVVAGLLIAPQKGEETRKIVMEESEKYKEKAKPILEKIKEYINKK